MTYHFDPQEIRTSLAIDPRELKPAGIIVRIYLPRHQPLEEKWMLRLCESLEGTFWIPPLECGGIMTIWLDAVGDIGAFHERLRLYFAFLRQKIYPGLRFEVEFQY